MLLILRLAIKLYNFKSHLVSLAGFEKPFAAMWGPFQNFQFTQLSLPIQDQATKTVPCTNVAFYPLVILNYMFRVLNELVKLLQNGPQVRIF